MMKHLLLFFLLTVGAAARPISFECTMSGMQFFPEQKEISLNSMFIIQGYAMSQETVESFRNRRVYLESSSGEVVELELQKIHKGMMGLTQAIFHLEKNLEPNQTYYLKYSGQTEMETHQLQKWDPDTKKHEPVSWNTSDLKYTDLVNPDLKLLFEKTEVQYYGCGPSANAIFDVVGSGNAEIWYKTEFVDLETNEKIIFFLWDWQNKLNVGHGMCAGAFTYQREGKYKVRFTAMNIDGKSIKTTAWVKFASPFENAENPWPPN